ncbi:DsrE family protein [Piscinibacter sakaiensis]|uniref:DsrE family protein n=1 Tax=Piscinibacter sakaiensis TaxID=1547922 RepID=UPI003AAC874C
MKVRHLFAGLLISAAATAAWAQDKVVYHINDTAEQALGGLRNVKNHLDTDPTAQITVVTHAQGVDFLMMDKKDKNGNPWDVAVQQLAQRGVKFEVCEITLKNRNLDKRNFISEAQFTPSGVVRLTKLQTQGYSYIKP